MPCDRCSGSPPSEHSSEVSNMAKDERLNMLRRNTAFTTNMRFRCDLPEPPSDPKLLIAPLHPEKLAKFALTSLERNPRRELVLEPDLGIHISLMDNSPYSVLDTAARLAPEDLALLEGDTDFSPASKRSRQVRERLRGSKAELSWLMRTSYISNDSDSKRKALPSQREKLDNGAGATDADEEHLKEVEASFQAAQQPPAHPLNPKLTPLEVTPVLPDFDRWGDNYVLIDFEGDPTADHAQLTKLSAEKRQQIAGEAVVKSYALPGGGQPFLAYLIPKTALTRPPADESEPREASTGEYEWVREYQYEVSNMRDAGAGSTYLLRVGEGTASYLDLNTRMKCTKRTRSSQGGDPRTEFPRPSKITVQKRPKTDQEQQAADQRRRELRGASAD